MKLVNGNSILLETQEDINYFTALLGGTDGLIDQEFGVNNSQAVILYNKLDELASDHRGHLDVSISH